ncbi:MAG: diacylglycerol kinase family protein, partial [Acidobacteriota bacterium]
MLINPRAGGGRAREIWERLRREVPRLAGLRQVRRTGSNEPGGVILEPTPEAAEEALVKALEAGVERLLVIGGDGTFSLAADVVALAGAGSRVPLGLIPAGTGSDLARSLGLPRDPFEGVRRALDGDPRPIDALELAFDDGRRRFAVNVVSAGVSSGVVERINALGSRGKAAYLTEAVKALLAYTPVSCRIDADGEPWHEGPLLLVAVANGTSFGGGMRIAPRAAVDDGLADLVLAPRVPGWQIPILLPRLYLGRHLSSRYVEYRRAKTVRIEPAEGFPRIDLDGDSWAPGAVTIRV